MAKYRFHATGLIAKRFDQIGWKYRIVDLSTSEIVELTFDIDDGYTARLLFSSDSNDNDVNVCIYHVIKDIPMRKRLRVLELCNHLNSKYRFVRFVVSKDRSVDLQSDIPEKCDDSCLGDVAVEMGYRINAIMDICHPLFQKALYSDDPLPFEE